MSTNSRQHEMSASSSSDNELDDLNCLNFPGDADWSSTVILRCDPAGGPYKLSDIINGLHHVVRRNDVYNLGTTCLNHAFVLSFKSSANLANFEKFLKSPKMERGLTVKGHLCTFTKIPPKCVNVTVRWIPLEVDTSHITNILTRYGTVVKTEWIKSNFRGWFHVYTNERRITLNLKPEVSVNDLPYTIEVKGLIGGILVEERIPKCLDCYYSGHSGEICKYESCILYQPQS